MEKLRGHLASLPDSRTGNNKRYRLADAALSAFGVFFTQTPSFLAYQRKMAEQKGKSNSQSLFGVHEIPSDNQIRNLLDPVPPNALFPVFESIWQVLERGGQLERFRNVGKTLLVALDGTEYFSSEKIHCEQCSTRVQKSDKTRYFHSVVTPVVVSPKQPHALPLVPEFVTPQDGHEKQDCEIAAAKRWLDTHSERLREWKVTMLGDDLYCRQPLCEQLVEAKLDFIFVCRETSHPTLYEHLSGINLPTVTQTMSRGRKRDTWRYRYLNDVPLRDGDDALLVNWCELSVRQPDGSAKYCNSFATTYRLDDDNVASIVRAGRTRWKVENENNNTLKTKGYHLEHNFGHGEQHLSSLLATLNILSLLFHTLLDLLDGNYKLLRDHLPTRQTFFDDLRALTRYLCFDSWSHLLAFMLDGLELQPFDDTT
ncbi:MAG: ISNCY family transposase [Geitlerinemataceae cyanobacterium]